MGQKIEIAFCARLIYSETENYRRKGTVDICPPSEICCGAGRCLLDSLNTPLFHSDEITPAVQGLLSQELFQSAPYRFSDEKNGACTAYIKRGAQQVGFENVNTFIRVFKEPLNKSPTADDGSFPPILRFEKREIHTVFPRFSNLVLTKNLSPSTAADLIRTSLRALRAFRPAFTRKRF